MHSCFRRGIHGEVHGHGSSQPLGQNRSGARHIEALDDSVKGWLSGDTYTIRKQVKDQGTTTRTAYRVHITDPLPVEWSAHIGDAAHNLRSGLDHLAFALNSKGYADPNQGAILPPADAKRSEFPIFGDEDTAGNPGKGPTLFRKALRKVAHVPNGARAVIEEIQPYQRGKDFRADPLWLIYELDRIDKHRELVLTAAAIPDIQISELDFEEVSEAAIGQVGSVQNGDELAYWVVPKSKEPDEDMTFTRGVAFGEGTPAQGKPPVETLRGLRDYVRIKVASPLSKFLYLAAHLDRPLLAVPRLGASTETDQTEALQGVRELERGSTALTGLHQRVPRGV